VTGLAVTREGIPVRVWCWPGSTAGSALIRQVKTDMRDWSLGRVIWVADRGFTSRANRKFLQQGGGAYITGEKLRSGSAEARAAPATRPSRGTCRSRKSGCPAQPTGSSSAATRTRPSATPPSAAR